MKRGGEVYRLTNDRSPLTYTVQTKDKRNKPLLWWDEEKQEQRALRFSNNQRSVFIDEQDDHARLSPVVFKDGVLFVGDREKALQTFLAHHPGNTSNGGAVFSLMDHEAESKQIVADIDMEHDASTLARELTFPEMEAFITKIDPDNVNNMDSYDIKRDVKIYARNNPALFLELVDRDTKQEDASERVMDFAEKMINEGLIQFRNNKTQVFYNLSDDKSMLFRVPEGQDPDDTLRNYFMTDEGIKSVKRLEKLL